MIPRTPEIILTTKAETLKWLAEHDETFNCFAHPVKSLWLCDELNRFELDGYVYNALAQDRIASENGLTDRGERRVDGYRNRTEGGLLGYLVYQAQGYRREMQLERGGWIRATQEVLAPFHGLKVQAHNSGSLSGDIVVQVKRFGERLRLCPLRTRTKAYAEYEDWWVKPLDAKATGKPSTSVNLVEAR